MYELSNDEVGSVREEGCMVEGIKPYTHKLRVITPCNQTYPTTQF